MASVPSNHTIPTDVKYQIPGKSSLDEWTTAQLLEELRTRCYKNGTLHQNGGRHDR